MWLEYRERSEKIILDTDLRKFAVNASEKDLLNKFQEAENMARKNELTNTGRDPSKSIELYYEAACLFREVVSLIDPEKVTHFNKIKYKWIKKENVFSFLIGFVSSFLVSMITG